MTNFKLKMQRLFNFLISLFLGFVLSLLLTFSVFMFFSKLKLISETKALIWAFLSAFLASIILEIYSSLSSKQISKSAFGIWIHNNKASLVLFYIFLCITFSSIKTEISWTYEKAINVLTLAWTILGFSIAMFLVWYTIIPKYLSDKKVVESDIYSTIQKAAIIKEKYAFYEDINDTFGSVSLLSLNVFILLVSTSHLFIQNDDITILSQNFVIISFYLCTNTFTDIFLGIMKPLKQTKKELLENANVCKSELDFAEAVRKQLDNTAILFQEIDAMDGINEEEKKKIKIEACKKFLLTDKIEEENAVNSSEIQNSQSIEKETL